MSSDEARTNGKDVDHQPPAPNGADERLSELTIYVQKKTTGAEGAETITFSIGKDGQTYLVNGDKTTALERIADILDEMD